MTKKSFADVFGNQMGQLVGHHVGPQHPENYDKPINIVTAKNGVFRVEKTAIGLFKSEIAKVATGKSIPGVEDMQAGVELLVPKIPFKYWLMVLQFYRDIYTKDKTEASVLFFWNTNEVALPTNYAPTAVQTTQGLTVGDEIKGLLVDGQLIVYCPRQRNSSGLSEFHMDSMVTWLRQNTTALLETHSHHTMDAFWSGTDDANENATGFYGVYGKITTAEPKFLFRYVSGDAKVNIDHAALFDVPQVKSTITIQREFVGVEGIDPIVETDVEFENYKGPWPAVEYPEDWMGQHTRSYAYAGNYGGGKYPASYGGASGGGTTYPSHDEYYDGAYGAYYAEQASKKKAFNEDFEGEEFEGETIETAHSSLQITADQLINSLTVEEIKGLLNEMADHGFDWIIAEALEEQLEKEQGLQ